MTTPPLDGEPLITLSQAARRFPGHRGADRLHPATLTRWILAGVKGPDGRRVRLEAIRAGNRWLTSAAALTRFTHALTPPADDPPTAVVVRSPHEQRRESDRAAAILIRHGA